MLRFSPYILLVLITLPLVSSARAQAEKLIFVWDNNLPNCGNNDPRLAPDSMKCVVTFADRRQLTFEGKELSVSMSHTWSEGDLRVLLTVENRVDRALPVDASLWSLSAYKSLDDLIAGRDPIFSSKAGKSNYLYTPRSMVDMSSSGLPSNAPVYREVTRSQTTIPSTGQIVNPNTRVVVPNGSGSTPSATSRIQHPSEKGYSTAVKWKEIEARSTLAGALKFSIEKQTSFVAVSFDINGTTYVYRLRRSR